MRSNRLRSEPRGWLTQVSERQDGYIADLVEFALGYPLDEGRDPNSTPAGSGHSWWILIAWHRRSFREG